jgi:D-glycero-D-manno-heptose 1,7-bisphosphate phosphatase
MQDRHFLKALFLDRDGVINIDTGYVHTVESFRFQEGIFDLTRLFHDKGYHIFIVTNQSGIARGYYTHEDFLYLTQFMLEAFEKRNIPIKRVEYCPHAPENNCNCRKPNTGMIDNILKDYDIDTKTSWLFGDKQSDMDLAKNANIKNKVAIGSKLKNCDFHFETISQAYAFLKDYHEL